jgi:cellulose synthase/poly-beta-1,6-N-acetylglucosamine synthase-like glycosyltransferase
MMIPILKDYYAGGYLPDPRPDAIPPYLPNVNLAVRREMFDALGGYDEACVAGEDADLCVRAARSGWSQFFDPAARAYHEPRPNLKSLVRQWIWYAQGGSHFFFKLQEKRLEIYWNGELTPKMYRYRRVLATSLFPIPAMVFLSPFPVWHLVIFVALLILAAGFLVPALLMLLFIMLLLAGLFRRSPLRRLSWRELCCYAAVAYLINWTCMIASFYAGLKKRHIFLYPGI